MSTTTLCGVCEAATASRTCGRCGTAVCDDHFDEELGLCVTCAADASGHGGADDLGPGDRPL